MIPYPRPLPHPHLPRPLSTVPAPAKAAPRFLFADLSDNNGPDFNALAYRSAGHIAIALKATQGTGYLDRYWPIWAPRAHEHRLAVLHYHFCQLENPVQEAQHFWATVRPHFNRHVDRLVIDLEIGSQKDWPAYLAELDGELHRLSGQEAIGYTFASALNPRLRLRSGLWWVAAWGRIRPSGPTGRLAGGAGTLWGWQYESPSYNTAGGPGGAAGIPKSCDMSVMRPLTVARIQRGAKQAWPGR